MHVQRPLQLILQEPADKCVVAARAEWHSHWRCTRGATWSAAPMFPPLPQTYCGFWGKVGRVLERPLSHTQGICG